MSEKSISTVALSANVGTFSEQKDLISPMRPNASRKIFSVDDDDPETPLRIKKHLLLVKSTFDE